jgi:hypothetical protein
MEHGPGPPMKLSEFLEIRARRREAKGLRPEVIAADGEGKATQPAL